MCNRYKRLLCTHIHTNKHTHMIRLEWNASKKGFDFSTNTYVYAIFIVKSVDLWCSVCCMWNGVYWITIKETHRRTEAKPMAAARGSTYPKSTFHACTLRMCKIMWVWNELNKSHKLHSIWVVHVTRWAFKIATIHPEYTHIHTLTLFIYIVALFHFGSCNNIGLSHQNSFQKPVEWQYLLGLCKKCRKS